ncbi:MAG TPA: 30S ribosomal protein S4, partial [Thermoplasmata archaeon]|nr:30S ribosomal protein S4 [Thermoplasmata archaeon]
AEKEREQLLRRLGRLGLLPLEGTTLDDVLALDVEAILSRRLQTLTFLKGLAFTPRQARQFIVHGHVSIAGRRVTIPGILVSRTEENGITYDERSVISSDLHPVRQTGQIPTPPAAEGGEEGPEDEPGPGTPGPASGPGKEA